MAELRVCTRHRVDITVLHTLPLLPHPLPHPPTEELPCTTSWVPCSSVQTNLPLRTKGCVASSLACDCSIFICGFRRPPPFFIGGQGRRRSAVPPSRVPLSVSRRVPTLRRDVPTPTSRAWPSANSRPPRPPRRLPELTTRALSRLSVVCLPGSACPVRARNPPV